MQALAGPQPILQQTSEEDILENPDRHYILDPTRGEDLPVPHADIETDIVHDLNQEVQIDDNDINEVLPEFNAEVTHDAEEI